MKMWKAMIEATDYGLQCCIRAKLDYQSDNGCMRDPVMYRCKKETHVRAGDKYK